MPLAYRTLCLVLTSLVLASAPSWGQSGRFSPRIEAQLDALKNEPSVQVAQTAALKFFNMDPKSVASMRTRAAWKGLMPQLSTQLRHNQSDLAVDTRNTQVDVEPFLFDDVSGTANEIQIGLRWDLPSVIFNPEVLDVGSLAILQEGVLKEVTRLYYTRRRLQIDLILNPPRDSATRVSKELRIEELTATLDAMTGNLFSNWAKNRPRRRLR